jgi:hypothetical protein
MLGIPIRPEIKRNHSTILKSSTMKTTATLPLAAALTLALASVSHAAVVVYTETFGNATGSVANISTVGWQLNYGATATTYTGNNTGIGFISQHPGSPQDLPNIGQAQASNSETNGFIVISSNSAPALVWTNEYTGTVPLTRNTLDSVSFYQANNAAVNFRVALQIAGQWFASTPLASSTIGATTTFNADATQLSLNDFTSSNWTQINFTAGSQLSLGTTGLALPDGTVTAFGVYRADSTVTRIDSFVVSVKPEPPSQPYQTWATSYLPVDLSDPAADNDGDGLSNFEEFAFGLDPTNGASVNPITDVSQLSSGTFSYTRLADSGLTYTVWASTDLQDWGTEPVSVTENPGEPVDGVVTVAVILNTPPAADKFFVRVMAVSVP